MTFEDWSDRGWLRTYRTSRDEVAALLAIADRDLANSQTPGLACEWRLAIAYNAALQAATAALAACGYRVAQGQPHHLRAIRSLALTIGMDDARVVQFDGFRRKRNLSSYDRAGSVSEQEAREMLDLARRLRQDVETWLRKEHPGLV
jgi:hypothetical protein